MNLLYLRRRNRCVSTFGSIFFRRIRNSHLNSEWFTVCIHRVFVRYFRLFIFIYFSVIFVCSFPSVYLSYLPPTLTMGQHLYTMRKSSKNGGEHAESEREKKRKEKRKSTLNAIDQHPNIQRREKKQPFLSYNQRLLHCI